MGPYDKELMMAILTASTALAGLAGVVIGQIMQSELEVRKKLWLKTFFVITFILAGLAIFFAIGWLSSPEGWEKQLVLIVFGAQFVSFFAMTIAFWSNEILNEIQALLKKARNKIKRTIFAICSLIREQIVKLWECLYRVCKKGHTEAADKKRVGRTPITLSVVQLCITAIIGGIGVAGFRTFQGGIIMSSVGIVLYLIISFSTEILRRFFAIVAKRAPKDNELDNWLVFGIALSVALMIGGVRLAGISNQISGIMLASIGGGVIFIIIAYQLRWFVMRKLREKDSTPP